MQQLVRQLANAWASTSWIEILAVLLALAYLVLAVQQRVGCWVAAFTSSCLYVWVLFHAHLYMESLLNLFFAGMAAYGYWQWTSGQGGHAARVCRSSYARNAGALVGIVALSSISSFFLRRFTAAAWPFADSAVTWASAYATFLVARKVYDNWYWWLAIDSLSLYLYYTRHLYLTMVLFAAYLVLIVVGMREWRRSLEPAAHAA